jgi:outer membrane protein W
MQKRARTFTMDSDPADPNRARATDENKFRLLPTALTASYRFTLLDDEYGIPVVPYVRAGLAYYLWWISAADGTASVCKDGSDQQLNPMCAKDKAIGASLGVQGSIGLSIRAERIDSSTATSMRQSGIQHAGIYGELSLASVSGFGSDSKLSVGDRTWFAGVAFEF